MSHRAYQPILPTGNKLLQKRWDQIYYDEHRRLVHTAKPMVDTSAPRSHPHITGKWKKQQIEKERAEEIERDNLSLLTKMQHIMETQGHVDHKNTYRHHSLNEVKRQRELERVAKENKQMLQRLQKVEPTYKVSDWIDDWQQKEELTELITAYPSRQPSASSRPKSRTLQPPAVQGTFASHKKRMAKTSVTAGRGSKVDPPIRTKDKCKPTVKQQTTSAAGDQTLITVGEEGKENGHKMEAKKTGCSGEEEGGGESGKVGRGKLEPQTKTQEGGGTEDREN